MKQAFYAIATAAFAMSCLPCSFAQTAPNSSQTSTATLISQIGPEDYPRLAHDGAFVCKVVELSSGDGAVVTEYQLEERMRFTYFIQHAPCATSASSPHFVRTNTNESPMVVYSTLRFFEEYYASNRELIERFAVENCGAGDVHSPDEPPISTSPIIALDFPHWSEQPATIQASLRPHICGDTATYRWVEIATEWLPDPGEFAAPRLWLVLQDN